MKRAPPITISPTSSIPYERRSGGRAARSVYILYKEYMTTYAAAASCGDRDL